MEKGNVLYAKKGEYRFQEVFFNGHPANKQNPNPPPPPKPKKTDPPEKPPENQPEKPPESPPPKKEIKIPNIVKSKKVRHGFLKFIIFLLIIVVLALAGGVTALLSRVDYARDNPDHAAVEEVAGTLQSDNQIQNIIIFGLDNHFDDDNGRADTMMLISIDKKHNALKQVSFLRDLYLPIFNQGEDKLNAAFAYGGAKLAIETIEYNFKIKIDNYIVLDFDSFIYIINSLGGLDITLTQEEINYIDWQSFRNHQVEVEDELMSTAPSFEGQTGVKVHVNGRQALWHARNRGQQGICSGDDFARTQRQSEVIDAVIEKVQSSSIADLIKIAYDVAPMITTNMNLPDTIKTSLGIPNYLKYKAITHKVPQQFNFDYDTVNGASVLRISNFEEEKNALYEFVFNKVPD